MADMQLTQAIIDKLKQGETEVAWDLFREAMQTFSLENKRLLIDQVLAVTAKPAEEQEFQSEVQSCDAVVSNTHTTVAGRAINK
ncbi:MAG: hypothetical protein C0473_00295 [Cyanobacteria bacterium DS3.002]|nr:hypothetical protein [Cyanobacteria bacterium DS3.002]MBA4049424.1 hypothetical protein [Cyanobacteria bacterium DS2.008]MBA4076010.1 hypothetical protein [Cyanobacteria bacterium PR.023]